MDAQGLSDSVAAVRQLFHAAAASCAFSVPDGSAMTFIAADGEGAADVLGLEVPVTGGLIGWATMSGHPVIVHDMQTDARFTQDIAERTGYVPTTALAAPFFDSDGDPVGVLEVLDPGVDISGEWPLAVLGTLAHQLTAFVHSGDAADADQQLAALGRRVTELVETYRG